MRRSGGLPLDRLFLKLDHRAACARARRNLIRQREEERTARRAEAEALAKKLEEPHAFPIGRLVDSGDCVAAGLSHIYKSGLILGGSGSGKSRFVFSYVDDALRRFLAAAGPVPEFQLLDPKGESFTFISRLLAARWLVSSEEARERLVSAVRVLAWRSDRVPPLAPYRRIDPELSDPFIARTRVDIKAETSATGFTPQMRYPYFMLSVLCVELGWPMSPRVMAKLFEDDAFRRRIAGRVRNEQLRNFLENFEQSTSTLVMSGLLRRLEEDTSFPQIHASTGMPVEEVDRILGPTKPSILLADVSASRGIPASIAAEQAAGIVIETLLRIPQRNPKHPLLIIAEELPVITEKVPSVGAQMAEGLRTMRSQNAALIIVTQDFNSALPASLLEPLSLNARWVAMFRSLPADASLLSGVPLVSDLETGSRRSPEKIVGELVEKLPPRHFFLQVRGAGPPIYLQTLDAPEPGDIAGGRSNEELDEIFEREFARRSLVSIAEAEQIITRWERSVLGSHETPESHGSDGASGETPQSTPDNGERGLERLIALLEAPRRKKGRS